MAAAVKARVKEEFGKVRFKMRCHCRRSGISGQVSVLAVENVIGELQACSKIGEHLRTSSREEMRTPGEGMNEESKKKRTDGKS